MGEKKSDRSGISRAEPLFFMYNNPELTYNNKGR
jgi:hypothetical protein